MTAAACHAVPLPNRELARRLLLETFGVHRVKVWCAVSEHAVYQWLSRGTDEEPIPPRYVPAIIRGAGSEGLGFDVRELWPAATDVFEAVVSAQRAEALRLARAH